MLSDYISFFTKIAKFAGDYSYLILYFSSLVLLWTKPNLYFYYNIGFFTCFLVNAIIKGLVQAPRPMDDPKKFTLIMENSKPFFFKDGVPFNIFGMPSGHTQFNAFSLTYIALATKDERAIFMYLVLFMLAVYNRIIYLHHSSFQILVGAILGFFLGIYFFYMADKNIMGKITEKIDDYGPL